MSAIQPGAWPIWRRGPVREVASQIHAYVGLGYTCRQQLAMGPPCCEAAAKRTYASFVLGYSQCRSFTKFRKSNRATWLHSAPSTNRRSCPVVARSALLSVTMGKSFREPGKPLKSYANIDSEESISLCNAFYRDKASKRRTSLCRNR